VKKKEEEEEVEEDEEERIRRRRRRSSLYDKLVLGRGLKLLPRCHFLLIRETQ